jgi:two-component system response regulator
MTPRQDVDLLLVDDSLSDVELTVHTLRKNNLANPIHIAQDGKEALDFIFCRDQYADREVISRPKVILLDLKLPKLDGLEVLKEIRRDDRTRAIPVVILTSSKEQRDLVESYHLGASAYIQKPVDFDEFRKTVREIGVFWLLVNQPPPPEAFLNH